MKKSEFTIPNFAHAYKNDSISSRSILTRIGSGRIAVIATCSLLIGAALVARYVSNALDLAQVQAATTRAESINDAIREFRILYTSEVVQRLKDQGISASHDYLLTDGNVPLPATMTKLIGEQIADSRNGSNVRLYSKYPFPWQVNGGPRIDIERNALDRLIDDPTQPFIQIDDTEGHRVLYYVTADIMGASCVSCHNTHPDSPKTDWEIGDVRGVLSVSIDLNAENYSSAGAAGGLARTLLLMTIIGGGIVALLVIAVTRWSRKENKCLQQALQDVANQKMALDKHAIVRFTDANGVITYVNDKFVEISGYSREELVGQSHHVTMDDDQDCDRNRSKWDMLSYKKIWVGEEKNYTKNGSVYWVVATVVPFTDEAGSITQHVSIQTDISDRKRSESELKVLVKELENAREIAVAADLSKSYFLANMSHEIRTPMTAILGFAETLSENVKKQENIETIEIIRRNGEYLTTIINDILDLSKVEAGKMSVESIPFNPHTLVTEIADLVANNAQNKGLLFEVVFYGDIPETIHSDPARLRQILINLVGNAIKFTEAGEVKLTVRLISDNDEFSLQFEVLDSGIGMTDEQISCLFQPFVQADNSTTRKFGGTGLGLTISKRFAQLLGGDITVPNSQIDVGTVFRVNIPVGSLKGINMFKPLALVKPKSNTPTKDIHLTDLTGLRILLAEDGPDNQRLISFILNKAGAQVVIVENGKLAMDTALTALDRGEAFDCILMDMQMPIMSGYDSTAALRTAGYDGPIIALTANSMAGDREKCLLAGCDEFAVKPIDRSRLTELVAQYSHRSTDAA